MAKKCCLFVYLLLAAFYPKKLPSIFNIHCFFNRKHEYSPASESCTLDIFSFLGSVGSTCILLDV